MRRISLVFALLLSCLLATAAPSAQQATTLRVVQASPAGAVETRVDVNEIRVVFSEPMIAVGTNPPGRPSWFRVTPAIDGAFRWAGTSILILTPDPQKPLAFSTTYSVTIDRTATSLSGRALAAPYQFTFTTPTVKLLDANWARQTDRYDSAVAIALSFNQRVRPADVLAHAVVRYRPHDFQTTPLGPQARARLAATDPAGLARYDAKVRQAVATSRATSPIEVRVAANWNKRALGESPTQVVLETLTVPPPGARIEVVIDARLPSLQGNVLPGESQSTFVTLTAPFFVNGPACVEKCEPSSFNPIRFSRNVTNANFAKAVSVRDITTADAEKAVTAAPPKAQPEEERYGQDDYYLALENAGFDRQPGMSRWLVRIDPSLATEDGQTLGYPWLGIIETGRDGVLTSFGSGHGVWEKDNGAVLPFYARNLLTARQWLAPVAPADLMARLRELTIKSFAGTPGGTGTIRAFPAGAPDVIQSHGFDLSRALSSTGTGLVWAAIAPVTGIPGAQLPSERSQPASTIVQTTNIGLTVKDSADSTLVFATRLDNGQAEADVEVSVVDLDSKVLWKGRTNKDGVAIAPALDSRRRLPNIEREFRYSDFRFIVIGQKNGDVAYVGSDWNEGIERWEFGLNYATRGSGESVRGSVFTDRGVYRPGEEVHFKTILRKESVDGVALFNPGTKVYVTVNDNRNRRVDTRALTMNKWSGVDWAWTIPADGSVGDYSVNVSLDPPVEPKRPGNDLTVDQVDDVDDREGTPRSVNTYFMVAAYRRPDFKVAVALAAPLPVAGEPMTASVEGQYLFGNPMARRMVRWNLGYAFSNDVPDAIRSSDLWKNFQFGYYPERDGLDRPPSESTSLDAGGRVSLSLPTLRETDAPRTYSFMGEVEDVTHQRIAGNASVTVYPAPFFVGLKLPESFANAGAGTTVEVATPDLGGRPRAGLIVKLNLRRIQWNSVRIAQGNGFYSWDTERVEVPIGSWNVTTGDGPISFKLPVPEGGYYELTATTADAAGHTTRTDASFYGIGDGYTAWERYDHNRIELKQEQAAWKPGDTARVMIQSPWESATALMTVEREGIRSYRRFELTSTQQTIDVPVSASDIPNLFVSVLLIRGRTSKDFAPDGGDPGQPSFRLGYTELHIDDASKRLKVNVTADREEYRPTNKAKVAVTAADVAGRPTRAEVTLWAVDYGVLSLTGYALPEVLRSVYVDRPLQVSTEDNRQRLVSRRVLTPKGEGEGGGGGADAGSNATRKDFRPLAFWLGSVETNSAGKATAEVTLPDTLTTYHIMAVAGDSASRFGAAKSEIRVSKPVTLLPSLPRFMSVGDRASIGGALTNTLGAAGNAVVTIKSLDPAILDVAGTQSVTVGAKETEAVRFQAAARSIGIARIQMSVKMGANSDAFETTVPVEVVAPLETFAASGETQGRAVEALAIPAGALAGAGGLTVDFASTALVGLGEGARYVTDYPFGCAEQKASKALVLVLAADLGSAFSMSRIAPKDYRANAASLLKSLANYQCDDGGFTYWPGQCQFTNAYLTSYVLHVMRTAETLGVKQDSVVMKNGLDYLERIMTQPAPQNVESIPVWIASTAFAVKVLAEAGRNQDANITRLYGVANRMPIIALSYLADAMAAAKEAGARYQNVIQRITNATRLERNVAHVESIDPRLTWIWDSNVNSSAVVLEGLARRGDTPNMPAPMTRWLLDARQSGRWANTHENARALAALAAYYKRFEAEAPNFAATATVGARALGKATFKGRSTTSQSFSLALKDVLAATTSGSSELAVAMTGAGTLFYTARLQYAPGGVLPAANRGIQVERRFETFAENGPGAPATSFAAGELVRVVLTVSVPSERRFVAVTDPLAAGFEPVEGAFLTTAGDLARESSMGSSQRTGGGDWNDFMNASGFDRVEKLDNRVELFATRLAAGTYNFTYLVRATTSGTFSAAGTRAEEMYAPDVNGRAAAATVIIK